MELTRTPSRKKLYYKPLEQVAVRVPLLPVEFYNTLNCPINYHQFEDKIKYAITVGSMSLADAFDRNNSSAKEINKDQSKLLRYLIRMSTRPTPYGLFAGVAMAKFGETTDLAIAAEEPQTHTRPDMGWLLKFVNKLEAQPEVLEQLHISVNPTIFIRGERLYLQERLSSDKAETEPRVSIRATKAVQKIMEFAAKPIVYSELCAKLLAVIPEADEGKIEQLLNSLLEQTILLTNLRPPLTVPNPAEYVLDILSKISSAAEMKNKLTELQNIIKQCDSGSFPQRISAYRQAKVIAETLAGASAHPAVQVDCGRKFDCSVISSKIGEETARAAELMLKLSPFPDGLEPLAAYKNKFENRYGIGREVSVLELLDPNFGLGIPSEYTGREFGNNAQAPLRNHVLLKLATEALRDKRTVVELTDSTIDQLKTYTPDIKTAPVSLDVCVLVAAKTKQDIDAGNFKIVIGPNVGAGSAGKMLGRFAYLMGTSALDTLKAIADIEKQYLPDKIHAELVYLPRRFRAGNVAVRPATGEYEIALGVSANTAPDKVIPLNELCVGVKHGRFYLRWSKRDEAVIISNKHMLNTYDAPHICRFLCDAGAVPTAGFTNFSWGPAYNFQFLPRVQAGRTVLSLAQWTVSGITFERKQLESNSVFALAFKDWQSAWNVPRYVYLTVSLLTFLEFYSIFE
ncbi:MAG: lantibiotic dehydratase family protein [Elusimicrobiaceae bacterium]